jgi:hypothetical protein
MMLAEIHNTKISVHCLSCGSDMKSAIGDLLDGNIMCDACKGVYDEAQDKDARRQVPE